MQAQHFRAVLLVILALKVISYTPPSRILNKALPWLWFINPQQFIALLVLKSVTENGTEAVLEVKVISGSGAACITPFRL